MGCFSYMCKECGKSILSSSFRGEKVKLFLLDNGNIVQSMEGEYDSYGRVFKETPVEDEDLPDSFEWEGKWGKLVGMHFNDDNTSGFAAIHSRCWKDEYPTTISEDDPDQGWGDDGLCDDWVPDSGYRKPVVQLSGED